MWKCLILIDCILWCFQAIVWAYCKIASNSIIASLLNSLINGWYKTMPFQWWMCMKCSCRRVRALSTTRLSRALSSSNIKTLYTEKRDKIVFSLSLSIGSLKKLFWSVKIDSSVVLLHPLLKVVVIREAANQHKHTHTQPDALIKLWWWQWNKRECKTARKRRSHLKPL